MQVGIVGGPGVLDIDAADGDLFIGTEQEAAGIEARHMAQVHRKAHVAPAQGAALELGEDLAELLAGADGVAGEQMQIGDMSFRSR